MPVEGLAGDPEFLAQGCNVGLGLAHRGHGQAHLRRGHLKRTTPLAPAGPGGFQAGLRPLGDQLPLKFGQCGKDPEHQLALGGGGVDRRTLTVSKGTLIERERE